MVSSIQRIQRRAAQTITGAFRTTAGTAADVEAHLLPVRQLLEQTALEAIIRIRTTPLYDAMATPRHNIPRRPARKRSTVSPLEYFSGILVSKYRVQLDQYLVQLDRLENDNRMLYPHGGIHRMSASPSRPRKLSTNVTPQS